MSESKWWEGVDRKSILNSIIVNGDIETDLIMAGYLALLIEGSNLPRIAPVASQKVLCNLIRYADFGEVKKFCDFNRVSAMNENTKNIYLHVLIENKTHRDSMVGFLKEREIIQASTVRISWERSDYVFIYRNKIPITAEFEWGVTVSFYSNEKRRKLQIENDKLKSRPPELGGPLYEKACESFYEAAKLQKAANFEN